MPREIQRRMLPWYVFALVVLALIVYAVVRSFDPSSVLRVGILKHESSLPVIVANERGLFAQHGLRVELVELSPTEHMSALLSGRVDVLSPTSFTTLFGVLANNPEELFALTPGAEVLENRPVYGFVVRASSPVKEVKDISGQVMAINPFTELNVKMIFSAAGANPPQTVVVTRDAALEAVRKGVAVAAIMDQPALSIAANSPDFKVIEPNPRARYIGSPYWSGSGAVRRETWVKRESAIRTYLASIDEAIALIRTDEVGERVRMLKVLGIDESVAAQCGGYYFPLSTQPVPTDSLQVTVRAMADARLLPAPIDVQHLFPPTLYGTP